MPINTDRYSLNKIYRLVGFKPFSMFMSKKVVDQTLLKSLENSIDQGPRKSLEGKEKEKMKVLSLFDGCGMTYQALKNLNVKVTKYYSSEIDKYAIKIAKKNHPELVQLHDVRNWRNWNIEKPDLIVAGSPCQGFSLASPDKLNFNDPRSALFFEFVKIVNHYKPKYFLLENVKMKQEHQDRISDILAVKPVLINSSLVSAQNRQRLYWCNWSVDQPKDRKIFLKDILETGIVDREKSHCLDANYFKGGNLKSYFEKNRRQLVFLDNDHISYRKLTPIECERLQTLPDNYTEGVSNTQRYKMLGNGFTVKVIEHILQKIVDQRPQKSLENPKYKRNSLFCT